MNMQEPNILDYLKGAIIEPKKKEAEEWFKSAYPGIFPNWKDYEANKSKGEE